MLTGYSIASVSYWRSKFFPRWNEAVNALTDIGFACRCALFDTCYMEQRQNINTGVLMWKVCVVCLLTVERAYAVACGPTLVYILGTK